MTHSGKIQSEAVQQPRPSSQRTGQKHTHAVALGSRLILTAELAVPRIPVRDALEHD